jgi:hypothetical protein
MIMSVEQEGTVAFLKAQFLHLSGGTKQTLCGSPAGGRVCMGGSDFNEILFIVIRRYCCYFFPYGSAAPREPSPPHFSRLHDHTL